MTESLIAVALAAVPRVPPPPPPPCADAVDGEAPAGPIPRDGSALVEGIGLEPKGGRLGVRVGSCTEMVGSGTEVDDSGTEMVGVGRMLAAPAATGIPISQAPASKANPTTRADATAQRYTTLI